MSNSPGQAKQLIQRFDLAAKYSVNIKEELVYTTWDDLVRLDSLVDFAGSSASKPTRRGVCRQLLDFIKGRRQG